MVSVVKHLWVKLKNGQAVACGISIIGALEAMYVVDRDVKLHEGQFSPFGATPVLKYAPCSSQLLVEDKGHAAMTSAEVSDAVSVPKFWRFPRLHVHPA